jgi:hypothetical protein
VNGEGGGRHGLHTDGSGAQADGHRREEATYVQSGEAELLAKAMRSETAILGLDSLTRLAAAEAARQGPRVDGQNNNRWKKMNLACCLKDSQSACCGYIYPTLIFFGNKLDGQD